VQDGWVLKKIAYIAESSNYLDRHAEGRSSFASLPRLSMPCSPARSNREEKQQYQAPRALTASPQQLAVANHHLSFLHLLCWSRQNSDPPSPCLRRVVAGTQAAVLLRCCRQVVEAGSFPCRNLGCWNTEDMHSVAGACCCTVCELSTGGTRAVGDPSSFGAGHGSSRRRRI